MLGLRRPEAIEEVREWDALAAGGEEGLREDMLKAIYYGEACMRRSFRWTTMRIRRGFWSQVSRAGLGSASLRTNFDGVGNLVMPLKLLVDLLYVDDNEVKIESCDKNGSTNSEAAKMSGAICSACSCSRVPIDLSECLKKARPRWCLLSPAQDTRFRFQALKILTDFIVQLCSSYLQILGTR